MRSQLLPGWRCEHTSNKQALGVVFRGFGHLERAWASLSLSWVLQLEGQQG